MIEDTINNQINLELQKSISSDTKSAMQLIVSITTISIIAGSYLDFAGLFCATHGCSAISNDVGTDFLIMLANPLIGVPCAAGLAYLTGTALYARHLYNKYSQFDPDCGQAAKTAMYTQSAVYAISKIICLSAWLADNRGVNQIVSCIGAAIAGYGLWYFTEDKLNPVIRVPAEVVDEWYEKLLNLNSSNICCLR